MPSFTQIDTMRLEAPHTFIEVEEEMTRPDYGLNENDTDSREEIDLVLEDYDDRDSSPLSIPQKVVRPSAMEILPCGFLARSVYIRSIKISYHIASIRNTFVPFRSSGPLRVNEGRRLNRGRPIQRSGGRPTRRPETRKI